MRRRTFGKKIKDNQGGPPIINSGLRSKTAPKQLGKRWTLVFGESRGLLEKRAKDRGEGGWAL